MYLATHLEKLVCFGPTCLDAIAVAFKNSSNQPNLHVGRRPINTYHPVIRSRFSCWKSVDAARHALAMVCFLFHESSGVREDVSIDG